MHRNQTLSPGFSNVRSKLPERPLLGESLVESTDIAQSKLDLLFLGLILTSLGVFLMGNLLVLLNLEILWYSSTITLVCIEIIALFYCLTRCCGDATAGLAVTYVVVWSNAYLHQFGFAMVFHLLSVIAIGYTIRFLRVDRSNLLSVVGMGTIGALTTLGVKSAYTSFCIIANLHLGRVLQDTLFLSSIAAMIKNYGVQSTGLHGLIEINYHTFSIAMFASISELSAQGVIECYGVAPWVLFAPLAIFSMACLLAKLDQTDRVHLPSAWIMICILLNVIPWMLSAWNLDHFFTAESQTVAMSLFLLGSSILFKNRIAYRDLILAVLISVLLGQSKGPIGIMWTILWLSRLVFLRGTTPTILMAGSVLVSFTTYFSTQGTVKASGESIKISPFHHIVEYIYGGDRLSPIIESIQSRGHWSLVGIAHAMVIIGCFVLFHYLFSWVVIRKLVRRKGIVALFHSPIGLYSLALLSASFGVIALFQVGAGNEMNFSVCAFLISFPVVSVSMLPDDGKIFMNRNWFIPFCLASAVLIAAIGIPAYRERSYFSGSWHYFKGKRNLLIDELRGLRENSPKSDILEATDDMKSRNPVKRCSARPFLFPSVSERSWVDVLQDENMNCDYYGYGYPDYGVKTPQDKVAPAVGILPGMRLQPSLQQQ